MILLQVPHESADGRSGLGAQAAERVPSPSSNTTIVRSQGFEQARQGLVILGFDEGDSSNDQIDSLAPGQSSDED